MEFLAGLQAASVLVFLDRDRSQYPIVEKGRGPANDRP